MSMDDVLFREAQRGPLAFRAKTIFHLKAADMPALADIVRRAGPPPSVHAPAEHQHGGLVNIAGILTWDEAIDAARIVGFDLADELACLPIVHRLERSRRLFRLYSAALWICRDNMGSGQSSPAGMRRLGMCVALAWQAYRAAGRDVVCAVPCIDGDAEPCTGCAAMDIEPVSVEAESVPDPRGAWDYHGLQQ